ncbi:FAD dependent oxidoreductase [Xylariomycetidae sp. FL2044]|nr:FAD dependent oxidoreductase [Xylariomycetidae sp. FL2044]
MATVSLEDKFHHTSGGRDSVWVHDGSYADKPTFPPLKKDLDTEVCIIGAGISGISTAYELIHRGKQVVLLDAREVLAGETGRTSGHLSSALDDGFVNIAKKHGDKGAKAAADSHSWAIERVGELARKHDIECEYRLLPAYRIPEHTVGTDEHKAELQEIKEDVKAAAKHGIEAEFDEKLTIKGWDGKVDQRGGGIYRKQATFHPTNYLIGILEYLKKQPNFKCYTETRVVSVEEKGTEILGFGHKSCFVKTKAGHTIHCEFAVEATDVPLQKLSVIAQMEWNRTYCIAIRVPKGSVEDCLIYDTADPYVYVRLTKCDEKDNYLVVGGCDHKVAQEPTTGRFEELERWARQRFPQAGAVDYSWSGQIFEPKDHVAFIGKNQGNKKIFIVTGDSGNGLTHGVLGGRLIADEITGEHNPWVGLYSPKRIGSILKSAPSMIVNDLQANAQYKRWLQSDIDDIEELALGCGGVINPMAGKPVAVYKDNDGKVTKLSAVCPHLKGVVCWNDTEKSWDCPVHGSRFGANGVCVQGPAKLGLAPVE